MQAGNLSIASRQVKAATELGKLAGMKTDMADQFPGSSSICRIVNPRKPAGYKISL